MYIISIHENDLNYGIRELGWRILFYFSMEKSDWFHDVPTVLNIVHTFFPNNLI